MSLRARLAPTFQINPSAIENRLRKRVSRSEFFALAFVLGFNLMLINLRAKDYVSYYDYEIFTATASGDFSGYYYGYWFLPVFEVFALLPANLGMALWGTINILGVYFAVRVFNGPMTIVLMCCQMLYALLYGQISGVLLAGLALEYWSLNRGRWLLAGIGFTLAVTKVQVGVPTGLAIWLLADCTWQTRVKMVIVPAVVGITSLIAYPLWIMDVINNPNPPDDTGSISLWKHIGPLALVFWLPIVWLPLTSLSHTRKLLAVACASAIAAPYFQQNDLLLVFMYPLNALSFLGNLGFVALFGRVNALLLITFSIVFIYGWALAPAIPELWQTQRRPQQPIEQV